MKVTITNAYTWFNKGDAGILLGTIEILKNKFGDALEVNVLSFTPNEDKKRYCLDPVIKDVYSNILNPRPYKNTKLGKLKAIIKLILKMIYVWLMLNINRKKLLKKFESLRKIQESDLVVVCGGGFLGGRKYDSLMHIFQIYVDRKLNNKVVILGTSIEPTKSGIVKIFTERVLKKLDYIYAREVITYDYLATFMPPEKVILIPDLAFMLENDYTVQEKIKTLKKKHDLVSGLTVRKWFSANLENPNEQMRNYIEVIAKTIDYFYENNNTIFVFVPQVIVENGNDTDVAKLILKKLKNKDALVIIEDDLSPVQIKNLISNFDIFLGTRMHSNIFAVSMGVPTVAIAYEKKTNGIMHTVGLDDYVVDINNISFDILKDKLLMCVENKEKIASYLNKKISIIRKEIVEKVNKIF